MPIAKKTTEELIELQKKHDNEFMFNFVKNEMERYLDKINCEYTYLEIWEEGIILFNELYNSTVEDKAHLISNKFDIYISRYEGGRQHAKEIAILVFLSAAFMAYYEYQINQDKEDIVNKLRFKNPHAGEQYCYYDDIERKDVIGQEDPYFFLYDYIACNNNVEYKRFNTQDFHRAFFDKLHEAYAGEKCCWDTNSCYIKTNISTSQTLSEEDNEINETTNKIVEDTTISQSNEEFLTVLKNAVENFQMDGQALGVGEKALVMWMLNEMWSITTLSRKDFVKLIGLGNNGNLSKIIQKVLDIQDTRLIKSTYDNYDYRNWTTTSDKKKNRIKNALMALEHFCSDNGFNYITKEETADN